MPEEFKKAQIVRIIRIFVAAHILNGFLCFIITMIVGGDGLLGFEKAGHFFVGQHGHYVEVPRGIFEFTEVQTLYAGVTMFASLVLSLVFGKEFKNRKLSLKDWGLISTVPLFWLTLFIIVRLVTGSIKV